MFPCGFTSLSLRHPHKTPKQFELFSKQQVVCYLGWLKSWKQRWVYPIYIHTYTHRNIYTLYIIHIFTFKVIVLRVWFVQVIIVVYSDILQLSNSLLNLDTPFYHHPGPSEWSAWVIASFSRQPWTSSSWTSDTWRGRRRFRSFSQATTRWFAMTTWC